MAIQPKRFSRLAPETAKKVAGSLLPYDATTNPTGTRPAQGLGIPSQQRGLTQHQNMVERIAQQLMAERRATQQGVTRR